MCPRATNLELPATTVFDYPTVDGLTDMLLAQLLEKHKQDSVALSHPARPSSQHASPPETRQGPLCALKVLPLTLVFFLVRITVLNEASPTITKPMIELLRYFEG